ncbi:hypothetical protein LPJ64_006456, partial [Coemansia asiatica]
MLPEAELLESIPDNVLVDSGFGAEQLLQMSIADRCRVKRLLFGVFEIPLTELGSGANNIKEIRMIPTEESDIQSSILSASYPHSGSGLDALTDSFWFNAQE